MVPVGRYLPDEKPGRRAKAFPTVCKWMHDDQLRKSKLYRSLANARTANDANNRAALKQTIAISFTSADRARVGAIRKARVSNADYWHQRAGRASIGLHSTPSWK